jgi:hypothetical protein
MEKYSLVKGDGTGDAFLEATTGCEVRITQQGKPRNYISYAMGLLVRTLLHRGMFCNFVQQCISQTNRSLLP